MIVPAVIRRYLAGNNTLASIVRRTYFALRHAPFRSSADYWERRYRRGGTSGAGSYNELARFKADFINGFVARHGITRVVEFGCGDGAQLALANYPSYVGYDVSQAAVDLCRARFAGDATKTFFRVGEAAEKGDLALSLDVIFHLVEDEVYEDYMARLFDSGQRYVVVYSSNENRKAPEPHVRHRRFTDWVSARRPEWVLVEHAPNAYPPGRRDVAAASFADFYVFSRLSPGEAGASGA